MRNRAGTVEGFNKHRETVLLHGQSRRDSWLPVIKRPCPEAASRVPVLVGTPGLDRVPCCIQPGQSIFNEALIKTQLRLRAEESEGGSGAKTCHEDDCQTAPEVQVRLTPLSFRSACRARIQARNEHLDFKTGDSRSDPPGIFPSK